MNGKAEFPFYLRIPSWCPNARIAINGNEVTSELIAGQYVQIHREWKNGDIVTLQMPMSLNVKRWQTNKNSASINYGPLTYSLLIKENYQKVNSEENAIWDSKWQ